MMRSDNKLKEMLTGYAAAHQHPFNVFVHMLGIPLIMFGVLIALSWAAIEIGPLHLTLAHLVLAGFFLFYLTLDAVFAVAFLFLACGLVLLAGVVADWPFGLSAGVAASCFVGGYVAQFVGHAVERSMPVLVKHPIQANLAAPFFTVVEVFKLLGLRETLFNEIQREIEARRIA